ncbi:hypothetical protein CERSUDRAFT_105594 [Gelatoporia subvermispora B]|uniref:Uncharacterized protein n=1 Tax=Ceriporiopsis subvermispora (strain B) TaxID=914234 RepID=M2QZL4_CERS8|nr:hypothetical protein CERSUDRAFT_105594 [Gelatoporia subvermispora B]
MSEETHHLLPPSSRSQSPSPQHAADQTEHTAPTIDSSTHPRPVLLIPASHHGRKNLRIWARIGLLVCGISTLLLVAPVVAKYLLLLSFEQTLVPFRSEQSETEIDAQFTQHCIQNATWTDVSEPPSNLESFSHVVEMSYDLPLSADLLYLTGRGALSHGKVRIVRDGARGSRSMAVHVSLAYDYAHMLGRIKVCLLRPQEGYHGVGVFSPTDLPYPARKYRTHFDVTIRLPPDADSLPTLVKRFESDMPLFSYQVDLPGDVALFDHLSLSTTNKPIIVKSLATNTAMIQTMNSRIEGTFSTSNYLTLRTLSAPIRANVRLFNANNSQQTQLWMRTSNSEINSTAELVSTSANSTGGSFKVHARSSNAPLDIFTPVAPLGHVLDLTAETSNAPTFVSLHSTWEGVFHLLTSPFFKPAVDADVSAPDPSGNRRRRRVHLANTNTNDVQGYAEWTPKERRAEGQLRVVTSNAPIHVTL